MSLAMDMDGLMDVFFNDMADTILSHIIHDTWNIEIMGKLQNKVYESVLEGDKKYCRNLVISWFKKFRPGCMDDYDYYEYVIYCFSSVFNFLDLYKKPSSPTLYNIGMGKW